jgi:uncharacterized protein
MQSPTNHQLELQTEPVNKRIQTFDILRGMALMGILIVHITSGMDWLFAIPEKRELMPFPEINNILGTVINFLFQNKSRTLFAFMFGVSFFLQFNSAKQKQKSFGKSFLWRMGILMIIGLLHAHLLFGADILRYYALGGLLLIFAHKWSDKALLINGFLLTAALPAIYSLILYLTSSNPLENIDLMQIHEGFMSTSYFDNFQTNHYSAVLRYDPFFLIYFAIPVTGIFLFGLWMARRNYIQEPYKHIKTIKRFCFWGLGLGFLMQLAPIFLSFDLEDFGTTTKIALLLFFNITTEVGVLLVSLGYVTGLTLLCLHKRIQKLLAFLAPAGRITLTNYVMQSVFVWVIFYGSGLGLYMKIGPAITIFIALTLGIFQLAASYYWLQYFKMGPLEWLWRYATSGKKPEFRMIKEPYTIN